MRRHRRPMKPREIVDSAKDDGLFSDKLAGKTPAQTMKAKISVNIRTKGTASIFVRTGPNTFYLRELLLDPSSTYNASRQMPPSRSELVIAFPSPLLSRCPLSWPRMLQRTAPDRSWWRLPDWPDLGDYAAFFMQFVYMGDDRSCFSSYLLGKRPQIVDVTEIRFPLRLPMANPLCMVMPTRGASTSWRAAISATASGLAVETRMRDGPS